jgi:hypothetical protein
MKRAASGAAPASMDPASMGPASMGPASGVVGPASKPLVQAPEASQKPPGPHSPSGSVIAGTSMQVPTRPGTMQDRHSPVHSSLQQMRSTHCPDPQSPSSSQLEPFARRRSHAPLAAQ